eukprot:473243-Pyramimonas_sp.AAC.1
MATKASLSFQVIDCTSYMRTCGASPTTNWTGWSRDETRRIYADCRRTPNITCDFRQLPALPFQAS